MFNFLRNLVNSSKKKNALNELYEEFAETEKRWAKNQEKQDHPYNGSECIFQRMPKGSPEQYYSAIQAWKYFVDYYASFYAPEPYPYNILSLDLIIDIAPKINDQKLMKQIVKDIQYINFQNYDKNIIYAVFNMAEFLQDFRNRFITKNPAKQKELVEILQSYIPKNTPPEFSDGTWYFYVWRQFGMVKVEKKGRFNYITLP